jgi:hypothetical protein
MFLSASTHTFPAPRSYQRAIRYALETFVLLGQLLHLFCLLCGPLVILGTLAGAVGQGERVSSALQSLFVAHTPWQALRTLWLIYSAFIWGVYVLPPWIKIAAQVHRKSLRRMPGQARWKHAALWGLVFGPLVSQYDRATVLPWPLSGMVIAGLVWAFYEMVWKDA